MEGQEHQAGGDVRLADALDRIARLRAESEQHRAENERLQAELAGLRQRLEELERQVGLNSGPSGQPPAGRRTRSQQGRSGQRSGGQPGPRGATLRQTANPDRVEMRRPPPQPLVCWETCLPGPILRGHGPESRAAA